LPLARPAVERDARSQNATLVGAPTGMVDPVLLLAVAPLQFSKKLSSQGKSRGFLTRLLDGEVPPLCPPPGGNGT
jgi:hypothetical protein